MTDWPTKIGNQFSLGFFVPLEVPVPPLSRIHAHGRFVIMVFFLDVSKLPWRGLEFAIFAILLPGGSGALSLTQPGADANDKEKQRYGPASTGCQIQGRADVSGSEHFEGDEGHGD
jgi:hypothetical protein